MKQLITLAFSPDTDDAFMVEALRQGQVDLGPYEFQCTAADIQQLNEQARHGVYDVTAISIAAYPALAADYLLMPVGASIGDEFGPALVVRADSAVTDASDLRGKTIAVPGLQTSAYLAARALLGDFTALPVGFRDVGPAVMSGRADAGILIHELQLTPETLGLRKVNDLGQLWWDRWHLPLPLGANAIRRSLGRQVISDVTAILRASIHAGLANREATLAAALAHSAADLDLAHGERYISMYVNHRSLAMAPDVREAMDRLFAIGTATGTTPPVSLDEALYE